MTVTVLAGFSTIVVSIILIIGVYQGIALLEHAAYLNPGYFSARDAAECLRIGIACTLTWCLAEYRHNRKESTKA